MTLHTSGLAICLNLRIFLLFSLFFLLLEKLRFNHY